MNLMESFIFCAYSFKYCKNTLYNHVTFFGKVFTNYNFIAFAPCRAENMCQAPDAHQLRTRDLLFLRLTLKDTRVHALWKIDDSAHTSNWRSW